MSLFQARDWWTFKPDIADECDVGCMAVGNVDNATDGNTDKIIVGTFSGYLRVLHPKQSPFKVDDLLIETRLDDPIIQVACGYFTSQSHRLCLAVLHPRKLAVYSISPVNATGTSQTTNAGAAYYELVQLYEHKLVRTAHSMTWGPFGGQTRDSVCVQSLDGLWIFYEADAYAFSRPVPNFVIPLPFVYIPKLDSFIVSTTAYTVDCYRYNSIGSSGVHSDSKHAADSSADEEARAMHIAAIRDSLGGQKKLSPEWSTNIGELITNILPARCSRTLTNKQIEIICVSGHSIFSLSESGQVTAAKRLDYEPAAVNTYNVGDANSAGAFHNLIVSSHQQSLSVYNDAKLVWAARFHSAAVPVSICVGTFGGIRGLVATLTDDASVTVTYMGTDPPITGSNNSTKELNYAAMDAENRKLAKIIKQANADALVEPKTRLTITCSTPAVIQLSDEESADEYPNCVRDQHGRLVHTMLTIMLAHNFVQAMTSIHLTVTVPLAFHIHEHSFVVDTIAVNDTHTMTIPVFATKLLPSSLTGNVVAIYHSSEGESRTARCDINLPLCLAVRPVVPLKNCQFMFTLDTNIAPPSLLDLFSDLIRSGHVPDEVLRSGMIVLSLVYWSTGSDVTVLVSKNSCRYRVQSGAFESLGLFSTELVRRLHLHYSSTPSNVTFRIAFNELLPLADYFTILDRHWEDRQQIVALKVSLARYAQQFRVIQKRLLVRYRERNPAPLNALDVMMNETFERITQIGNNMKAAQEALSRSSSLLSCSTTLILLLLTCKHELDPPNQIILSQLFMSDMNMNEIGETTMADINAQVDGSNLDGSALSVTINTGIGWEECVESAMMYALKTGLAKAGKESLNGPVGNTEPLKDINKLKKHIQMVTERLEKGMRMSLQKESTSIIPEQKKSLKKRDTPVVEDQQNISSVGDMSSRRRKGNDLIRMAGIEENDGQ